MSTITPGPAHAHASSGTISEPASGVDNDNATLAKSTPSNASLTSAATAVPVETSESDIEPPKEDTMAEQHYRYKVQMTCGGCSGAIERVLKRAKETGAGVTAYDVSLENQSVNVFGTIDFADLTTKIEKTGKKILDKEVVTETPVEVANETSIVAETETVAVA